MIFFLSLTKLVGFLSELFFFRRAGGRKRQRGIEPRFPHPPTGRPTSKCFRSWRPRPRSRRRASRRPRPWRWCSSCSGSWCVFSLLERARGGGARERESKEVLFFSDGANGKTRSTSSLVPAPPFSSLSPFNLRLRSLIDHVGSSTGVEERPRRSGDERALSRERETKEIKLSQIKQKRPRLFSFC